MTGHRDLINSGPGNRGLSARGTNTRLRLEFLRETGLILRCAETDIDRAQVETEQIKEGDKDQETERNGGERQNDKEM